jgi:hypothetical protein
LSKNTDYSVEAKVTNYLVGVGIMSKNNCRPICVNHGCNKPVTYSHVNASGQKRWRPHCGHCQGASYGRHPHAPGVTPFKTGRCSNSDGHLGFKCAISYRKAPWAVGMTEIDHKNGDCSDNCIENLDELCPMCHRRKGSLFGDYDGWKNYTIG